MVMRRLLGLGLVAVLGACDSDAGAPRSVEPLDRAADAGAGVQILATLEVSKTPTRGGGGLWVAVRSGDDDATEPTLFHFNVIDPEGSDIDVYADVTYELHALSDPLTDEQLGALTTATSNGAVLHIVSDSGIEAPTGIAQVRFATVDDATTEIVAVGALPFRLLQG